MQASACPITQLPGFLRSYPFRRPESESSNIRPNTFHYAWIIAGAAMLVVLGGVGLARFAFGMILPLIANDLDLSYRQQGILGASYFIGYLGIVALMPWLAPKLGPRRLCVNGLVVVSVGLLAMAFCDTYWTLSAAYLFVGFGSGVAFVGAMSLPAQWFHPSHRARGAGVAAAGAGVGILFSGLLVPEVSATFGMASWQLVWLIFAALNLAFAVVTAMLIRNKPSDLGLEPFGRPRANTHAAGPNSGGVRREWRYLAHLGIIYALFAATGLTYTTFVVTTMVDTLSITTAGAGLLWAGVGGLSIFSGSLFGAVSDRFGHRVGMVSALSAQALSYTLIAADTGMAGLYGSIMLFGISAWSMPSIVAAAAGDRLGPQHAAAGFAILTLMFALGQVLGPAGAGMLADWSGGFSAAYALSAALNVFAIVLCLFLRRRRVEASQLRDELR